MAKGGFRGGYGGGMNQASMMKQAQKMQEDLLKMQEQLETATYTATAGGGAVKAVGAQMMAHQYGIGFPKGSELTAKVNAALADMKADGRWKATYTTWLAEALGPAPKPPAPVYGRNP